MPSPPRLPSWPRKIADAVRRGKVADAIRRGTIAVLPGQCQICGDAAGAALCDTCDVEYWQAEATTLRCRQCGIRVPQRTPRADEAQPHCGRCIVRAPAFDATLALADYRAPLDILAIKLKFHGKPALAAALARRMAARLRMPGAPLPDLLIPVPASTRRLSERGYNQAWELARRISQHCGIDASPRVLDKMHTAAQSALDVSARQRNLRRAIRVAPGARSDITGRHIGVIDDVMTSGATLDAVAQALKAAGARRVTNLILFRTA